MASFKDDQKKMKRKDEGDYDDDWMTKRERERRQTREEEQKTDWVFERYNSAIIDY